MKLRKIGLIFALFFLGEIVLLANGEKPVSQIEKKYLSGRQYFREGNYENAIKQFEWVAERDPNYKVAAEYLKRARARLLEQSKKNAFLQKRKEALEEVDRARAEKKAKAEEKIKQDIDKIKENWQRWLAKEQEKKKVRIGKKEEKAVLDREKELFHHYGLDELERLSQNSHKIRAKAEVKNVLKERQLVRAQRLPSPQRENAMARVYIDDAKDDYNDKNYDEAIKRFEKASAIDPSNPLPQKYINKIRHIRGQTKYEEMKKAEAEHKAQVKYGVEKYCSRAKYLYRHKDYKGSIDEFRKAWAIDPNSKIAKSGIVNAEKKLMAIELKEQKRLQAKKLREEKARKKIDIEASKIVKKGNRYLKEKKFFKAKKEALKALRLNPDSRDAKTLLENATKGLQK